MCWLTMIISPMAIAREREKDGKLISRRTTVFEQEE